jgi:hypothetical protein
MSAFSNPNLGRSPEERELLEAFEKQCAIWGVGKSQPRERAGRNRTGLRELVKEMAAISNTTDVSENKRLPDDIEGAIRIVFTLDLEGWQEKHNLSVVDALFDSTKDKFQNAPFNVCKWTGRVRLTRTYEVVRRAESELLDPFKRFSLETTKWSQKIVDRITLREGLTLEVIVAQFARLNKACLHCKRIALVWGGGSSAAWKDMVCTACNAAYEIKVKNYGAISKINNTESFDYHTIKGGSFKYAHTVKEDDKTCPAQFMIVVDRDPHESSGGTKTWSVFQSKIKRCLRENPQINP